MEREREREIVELNAPSKLCDSPDRHSLHRNEPRVNERGERENCGKETPKKGKTEEKCDVLGEIKEMWWHTRVRSGPKKYPMLRVLGWTPGCSFGSPHCVMEGENRQ